MRSITIHLNMPRTVSSARLILPEIHVRTALSVASMNR